ncbi:MAG: YraN family protein [Pseudomonadota bacterium]
MIKISDNEGELLAIKYLQENKFKILERNYQARPGEIDIIASKKGVIHFIEVKLRSNEGFGEPEEYVTPSKLKKIQKTAQYYLYSIDGYGQECQFDVIAIFKTEKAYKIKHFDNVTG